MDRRSGVLCEPHLAQPRELRIVQRRAGGLIRVERTLGRALLRQNGLHLLPSGLPLPYRQGRVIQGKAVGRGETADYRLPEAQSRVNNELVRAPVTGLAVNRTPETSAGTSRWTTTAMAARSW